MRNIRMYDTARHNFAQLSDIFICLKCFRVCSYQDEIDITIYV